jgi:hydrogenase-4 component J
MADKIIFYSLSQKFLEREEDIPAEAKQVMYYSLAIGHHLGVIDCLKPILECPLEGYKRWIERLPEGEARRKLEGALRFGEINIDITHVAMLRQAFTQLAGLPADESEWTAKMFLALDSIEAEPAVYLMARQR